MIARVAGEREGQGFTIIEVMVAILLLAVAVVSIFGAQFTAVATADYSSRVTQAIQLARCRMSELELEFQTEDGFEEGDVVMSGECCELMEGEESAEPFTCSWEVKAIQLPDITQMMMSGGADAGLDGEMGGMGDMMGGGLDDFGMAEALAPMVTGLLEQAIRRVTVTVEWDQGARRQDLSITQYVVHPTQGPLQLLQQAKAMDDQAEELLGPEGEDDRGGRTRE